jgi:hypothetical protein
MDSTHNNQAQQSNTVQLRRRRLLTGSGAGIGVLLAVQAKTALGSGVCQSPSAMISGNTSPRPGGPTPCSGGRSPGYWKQPGNFGNWCWTPPSFKDGCHISDCKNGLSGVTPCDIKIRGTTVGSVFPGAPGGTYGIWEVLVWPTQYPKVNNFGSASCSVTNIKFDVFAGKGQLLRHLACAYLNASALGTVYPITTTQITQMWNAVKSGGKYYPQGSTSLGMTATDIINYISGMYDSGNADNLEGCLKY